MTRFNRIRVHRLGVALAVVAAIAGVSGASAPAQPFAQVETGSLAMVSDPGDTIGRGLTYSFSTPEDTFFATQDGNRITVGVNPFSNNWVVQLAAPPLQQLAVGTYSGAVRTVSRTESTPGMDVYGEGSGCNELTGTFTVDDLAFGPFGYVEHFHATFEQHCQGVTPALRGEVSVENPPPPPVIDVQITVDPQGKLSRGGAFVSGTVTCNRDVDPERSNLVILVTQETKKGVNAGVGAIALTPCLSSPTPWRAEATQADAGHPLVKGTATVNIVAQITDPFYGVRYDAGSLTTTTYLREG